MPITAFKKVVMVIWAVIQNYQDFCFVITVVYINNRNYKTFGYKLVIKSKTESNRSRKTYTSGALPSTNVITLFEKSFKTPLLGLSGGKRW